MFDIHTIRLGCFSVVEVRSYVPDNNNMMRMNQPVFKICHGIAHRTSQNQQNEFIIYHVLSFIIFLYLYSLAVPPVFNQWAPHHSTLGVDSHGISTDSIHRISSDFHRISVDFHRISIPQISDVRGFPLDFHWVSIGLHRISIVSIGFSQDFHRVSTFLGCHLFPPPSICTAEATSSCRCLTRRHSRSVFQWLQGYPNSWMVSWKIPKKNG